MNTRPGKSDMKGDIVDRRRHPDVDEHPDNEKLLISHLVDPLTPTDTYMYRAETLRRIGMFDDVLTAQEYLLMLKTITSGAKIGYIRQSLVMRSRKTCVLPRVVRSRSRQ